MTEPPRKRRKGGLRQRLEKVKQESGTPGSKAELNSSLARYLVESWSVGTMSPQQIQKIASLAMQDFTASSSTGTHLQDLAKLASLGQSGRNPNNCHKDLLAFVDHMSSVPAPVPFRLPFKVADSSQNIMLPHVLFSAMHANYGKAFEKTMLGNCPEQLPKFWQAVRNHPSFQSHPLLSEKNAGWQSRCIPLSLHGDGVPISGIGKVWAKLMTSYSWSSMLGSGNTSECQNYIWSVTDACATKETTEQFFSILKWSFNCLYEGKWPEKDYKGNTFPQGTQDAARAGCWLADGFRGVLFSVLGDLDYLCSVLSLPRWSRHDNPCTLCLCKGGNQVGTWMDFQFSAGWQDKVWTAKTWKSWEHRSKNPIFQAKGVTGVSVGLDYMHGKYLGSDLVQFGAVVWLLVNEVMPQDPETNLKSLWSHIKDFQKRHKVKHPFRYLTKMSMFTRKKGPHKLRAKAAEAKSFVHALANAWARFSNPNDETHKKIALMLKLNIKMETTIDEHCDSMNFPTQDAKQFAHDCFAMCHIQHGLQQYFKEQGNNKLMNITSKCHFLCHIALNSKHLNPRRTWCFSGEDQMRRVQRLAQNCVRRLNGMDVPTKMVRHLRIALHFAWQKC